MSEIVNALPHVLILGGGFAGLQAVQGLAKAPVRITLVDRRNYHLFQPLLYQVATAVLSPEKIAAPLRRILKKQSNVRVALAHPHQIDLEARVILTPRGVVPYDYLVLAVGLEQSYFGHNEFRLHAPGMKSLEDAIEVRRRILLAFEEAEYELDDEARRGKLTFVIVGGGPTGVELAGAIRETAAETLPSEFRYVDTATARIILIEGGDRLLGGMPKEMGMRAKRDLENMGIEVHLNTYVTAVDANGALIGDTHVPAENVFWAAGVKGTALAHSLGVELDRIGRIKVNSDLSVPGHPRAFVAGDAANVLDPSTGDPVPAVAQGAIQMGKFVAEVITQDIDGANVEDRPSFHYKDKGSMAAIGRGKALASIGKVTLGGFIGWMMWGLIHILFLVGFRTKVVVMFDWIWNYIGHERGSRLITGDPEMNLKVARGVILSTETTDENPQS